MPRPITDFYPVWWVRDIAHAAEKNFIGKPDYPNRRPKFWRDDMVLLRLWDTGPREYKVIARNDDGSVKLTPIGSKLYYDTYTSLNQTRVYEQYSGSFPAGVPYLEKMVVPEEDVDLNFGGVGKPYDYPFKLEAGFILVPQPSGDPQAWGYQEFAGAVSVPASMTLADRRSRIARIASNTAINDTAAIQAIRELVTFSGNGNVQIS